jgi:hypothetical protein
MTVQQTVHEPQDFPGTMAGAEAALPSSAGDAGVAGPAAPARSVFLRFASPIRINPLALIVEGGPREQAGETAAGAPLTEPRATSRGPQAGYPDASGRERR